MTTDSPQSSASPPRPPRRVVMNTAFSLLTKLQGAFFSYTTTLLLLRAVSVDEYGLYSVLFIGTLANVNLLGKLGLPSTLMRFVPEYFTKSKWRLISRLFVTANLLQCAFSAVLLALTFLFASQIAGWIKFPHAEGAIRVFAVGAFAALLTENYRLLLSGLFMHRQVFYGTLIYNSARLAAIYAVTRRPNPFMAVVIAEAALYGFFLLVYYVMYRRTVQPRVRAETGPDEPVPWRRFSRYTILSYINEVGVMLLNSATDLFLVSGYLGGAAAGLYGLANRIMSLLQHALPSNFLQGVISPLFFSEYGASRENARFGFTLLMKLSLFVTWPMAVWTVLMARPMIVHLFDARYADASGLLVIMVAFLPMEVMRYPVGLMLQNAERNDLLIYSKIFGVLKIAIGLWLLPIYGITTMAWISGFAVAGQNTLSYIWIVKILKTGTDLKAVLRLSVNGLISALLFWPLTAFFNSVIGVIGSIFVYMVVYLLVNVVHKTFTPEERKFINSKMPVKAWVF